MSPGVRVKKDKVNSSMTPDDCELPETAKTGQRELVVCDHGMRYPSGGSFLFPVTMVQAPLLSSLYK